MERPAREYGQYVSGPGTHAMGLGLPYGTAQGSFMTGAYSQPGGGLEGNSSGFRLGPIFMTQDQSAWLLEELASRLRELLTRVVEESNDYAGLPDFFVMPPSPTKKTSLRVVRR